MKTIQEWREYHRNYYAKNKKIINARKCAPVYCEICDCWYRGIVNKGHHNRTRKHQNNLCIE